MNGFRPYILMSEKKKNIVILIGTKARLLQASISNHLIGVDVH